MDLDFLPRLDLDPHTAIIVGAAAWGIAGAALVWAVLSFLGSGRRPPVLGGGKFEVSRQDKMRQGHQLYAAFEPGMGKLAAWNAGRNPKKMEKLANHLVISGEKLPWLPEEFVAIKQIEGFLTAILLGLVLYFLSGDPVIALGGGIGGGFFYLHGAVKGIEKKAARRLHEFKRRLPFAIDLMALMMEAGASFQEAMTTVVRESRGHPLAEELNLVLRDISLGRTRKEALITLQGRLKDDDVTEVVFAVNKGEELGTPLGQILRNQAEQMRLKRSQWMEKASGEAQVNIVFPGMIIMIACLLIVAAPFILSSMQPQQ